MYECIQCGKVFNTQPLVCHEANDAYLCSEQCLKDFKRFLDTMSYYEQEVQLNLPFVPP